jgi:hypothetical protein
LPSQQRDESGVLGNPADIFRVILETNPTAAVRPNPEMPAELERILNKALEKDQKMRYQRARKYEPT